MFRSLREGVFLQPQNIFFCRRKAVRQLPLNGMRSFILILCATAAAANAQVVSFGFKTGVPALDAIPNHRFSSTLSTGRWTLGPTVEFRLLSHVSVEVDALFRGFTLKDSGVNPAGDGTAASSFTSRQENKAWDFPFLLKYRLLTGRVSPFLNGGISITHQSTDISSTFTCQPALGASCPFPDGGSIQHSSDSSYALNRRGLVAGGGVEFRYEHVTFAPEFRYTRLQNLATNQATVLLGVRF